MTHSRVVLLALLIAFVLCIRPAHSLALGPAFPQVIPAGQSVPSPAPLNAYSDKSVYYEMQRDGSAIAKTGYPPTMSWLTGAPDITASNLTATSANPDGYVSKVNASGAAVLESSTAVKLAAPPGALPSPAVVTAAAGMAGAGLPDSTFTKTVPLGGGAGSLASSIGKSVLNVGAGAAAFVANPVFTGTLMALQVGMAGYDFYQNLKGQGIAFNANGSATVSSSSSWSSCPVGWCTALSVNIFTNPGLPFSSYCPPPASSFYGFPPVCAAPISAFSSPPAASGAVSNDQMAAAIDKATLDAHIAADLAAVAIARGYPLPIPNGFPGATTSAVSAKSNFSEVKTSTDALGNKTSTLERNVVNVAPSVGGAPPVMDMRRESVTVLNAAPQTVTSTSLAPTIAGNVATAAAAQQQAQKDLCADHPEILACADITKVNDVPDVTLGKKDITVTLTPVVLPSGLMCPMPTTFIDGFGRAQVWDIWSKPCAFAPQMKPIVLAFAWLAAGMIIFVGRPYAST